MAVRSRRGFDRMRDRIGDAVVTRRSVQQRRDHFGALPYSGRATDAGAGCRRRCLATVQRQPSSAAGTSTSQYGSQPSQACCQAGASINTSAPTTSQCSSSASNRPTCGGRRREAGSEQRMTHLKNNLQSACR